MTAASARPLRIDPAVTPFSRRGSWFNLACPRKAAHQVLGPGLYLRTSHHRPIAQRELFKLALLRDGVEVPHRIAADAHALRLVPLAGGGEVEIVIDGDTVRVRGEGVGCRFASAVAPRRDAVISWAVPAYPDGPDGFVVNARPSLHRYRFGRLRGAMAYHAPFRGDSAADVRVDAGGDGAPWELAIDEHQSTWTRRRRGPFATVVDEARREVASFLDAFPTLPVRWRETGRRAAWLLWTATKPPAGLLRREAVFMSLHWMDQVWSWDHAFNAAALAPAHPRLALDQMLVIADHQDRHGAFPDAVNDGFKHYCFSKPPVHGVLVAWMRRRAPRFLDRSTLHALYRPLARSATWWLAHRRWPGQGLCHYLHGNDAWDNGTLLREGAPVIAPDLNAFLAVQCATLAWMADRIGRTADRRRWSAQAATLGRELVAGLWRSDGFVGRLPHRGEDIAARSLAACMPIVLGRSLPSDVRSALVARIRRCVTRHGLATEEPGSPFYEEDGYWRGPTWGPSTLLIVHGLAAVGEDALARRIARRYCATCARIGFPENYGSLTGRPFRDPAYTWTASVFLELARAYG